MECITYIAKSAGILTLFYLVYAFVLRKDTFFIANRTFLLVGIGSALFLPFVTFTSVTLVEAPVFVPAESFSKIIPLQSTQTTPIEEPIDVWQVILVIYFIGLAMMLVRFAMQLLSLFNLLRKYPSKKVNEFRFVEIKDPTAPFSFFNYIVFNPKTHNPQELEMILQHEKVHAVQWHTIDVLLSNLICALQWSNPVSWLYKKCMEANLEFLADHQTASSVSSKTEYQLALLKASSSLPVPALTNNFYQSFTRLNVLGKEIQIPFQNGQVKKRIIMLNKSNSNKYNQFKLMLVLPALALFLWSFNTKEVIKYTSPPTKISSEKNNDFPIEKKVMHFSAETTNTELDALEDYFTVHHPESLVKIADRKRDASGKLLNFSFQTKFKGNDRFYTRFDRSTDAPFNTIYTIQAQENDVLLVSETGKDTVQFKISKKRLVFLDKVIITDSDSKSVREKPMLKDPAPMLGENPLYIINGKEYLKNELPKEKTIELDGTVEVFNTKEGAEKYGEKGKEGVLFFNGVSTFVEVNKVTSEQKTKAPVKSTEKSSVKEIRIKISKNTTKDELQGFKNELKKLHDIEFNYSNVNFNNKGEITSITIQYSGLGNNGTYSVSSDDGAPIADFYFYMDAENGTSGFGSRQKALRTDQRKAMLKQRQETMETRKEALTNAAELRKKIHTTRNEHLRKAHAEIAETRRKILTSQSQLQKEAAAMRKAEAEIAKANYKINTELNSLHSHKIVITKHTTDAQLKTMKTELSKRGVTFNYKRVKRNNSGEITSIKATFDNGKGSKVSKSIQTDDDEAINPIVVHM